MKISRLGEFGLIERIKRASDRPSTSVLIGIGDDAAALDMTSTATLLVTTDMLIEGIHFDLVYTDFYSLGWKSAAVNLSDIAAMGGRARYCLVSLGIPRSVSVEDVAEFYRGCNDILRRHRSVIVGGDTCSSQGGMIVSITMMGDSGNGSVLKRSGAKPGDRIFVTGTPGDSAAGLELLQKVRATGRLSRGRDRRSTARPRLGRGTGGSTGRKQASAMERLIERHLRPIPRLEWAGTIAVSGCANSMIDISDGLSSDLFHLCEQSKVGAVLDARKIPLSESMGKISQQLKKPAIHYALSGGEDYELLFTVPPAKVRDLLKLPISATEIGEITKTKQMIVVSGRGKTKPLPLSGFDHFPGRR